MSEGNESQNEISVHDYILQQDELEHEANELMPYDPSQCTYAMGAIRQQIYACLSCGNIGVCYSCAIQCHTSCDLVELFDKRNFSCDCGTERQKNDGGFKPCTLRKNTEPDVADMSNRYGQNFKGLFCSCHTEYDPNSNSTMIQCALGLECNEDWFHDHCILGMSKNPDPVSKERHLSGFPSLSTFDSFICWQCTHKYASQFQKLISSELADEIIAEVLPFSKSKEEVKSELHRKRRNNESDHFSLFLKPGYKKHIKALLQSLLPTDSLYLFLKGSAQFLYQEEKTYEPPEDKDATSILELGNRVLSSTLSHQQAMEGLAAFEQIKTKLSNFLRPFADSGKVVSELDIKTFFENQKK